MKLTRRQLKLLIEKNLKSSSKDIEGFKNVDPADRARLRRKVVQGYLDDGSLGKIEIVERLWMMFNPEGSSTSLSVVKNHEAVLGSNVDLLFDGDYLHWRNGGTTVVKFPAIAGVTPWNEGSWLRYYKDVRDFSKMKSQGPPPEGEYSVGRLQTAPGTVDSGVADLESSLAYEKKYNEELWGKVQSGEITKDEYYKKIEEFSEDNTNFYDDKIRSRLAWGKYRASFKRYGKTKTHGRGGFYIHGGDSAGSHGCIDLLTHMDDFAKLLTFWRSQSRSKKLILTVKYAPQFSDLVNKWVDVWDDGEVNQSQNVESMLENQLSFLKDDSISMTEKVKRVAIMAAKEVDSIPVADVIAYMKRQGYTLKNIGKFTKSVYDYMTGNDLEAQ